MPPGCPLFKFCYIHVAKIYSPSSFVVTKSLEKNHNNYYMQLTNLILMCDISLSIVVFFGENHTEDPV